jgi:HEAT repeat protein
LWHAVDAAKGTAIQDNLIDAIMRLLTDPDVEVRTRAIVMAQNYAPNIDPSALLSALRNHPKLYEGVKPEGVSESYMPDLAWGLIQAMNAEPKGNPEVIAVLRKAVEDPTNGFRVMGGLAAEDPTWVVDRATKLVSGQPVRARIILANLSGPRRREQFVRALADEPADFRRELVDIIGEVVKNPDERQRLAALLA